MRIGAAVVVLAILIPALNQFITATALPTVVGDIGGLALYAWATIAYAVTSIVGSAASSAVARRLGLRAGLAMSGVVFAIGSAACATAPTMAVIVAGRAVQGLGGGMIVGIVHGMIREVFPAHLWPRMLATVSVAWGVAALSGPAVGGILAQHGLWRVGFWAMIPFVAATIVLAWRLLPARRRAAAPASAIPFGRLLLLCAAVLSLALVGNTRTIALRAALLTMTAGAIAYALALDRRAAVRLFPSGMLSLQGAIGKCFWIIFLLAMAASPTGIYMSLLVQQVHGVSPASAGYIFAANSLAWTAAAIVTARIPASAVRTAIVLGPLLMAAGLAGLFLTIGSGPVTAIALAIVVQGTGIGTCWAHVGNVVLGSARADEEEATAALIPSTQLFAIAFGGALCAVIAGAVGLTREASPAIAAATGQVLFGGFVFLALAAAAIARSLGGGRDGPLRSLPHRGRGPSPRSKPETP